MLAGFGVELAVKNMEYSQVDDAEKGVQKGLGNETTQEAGEASSFQSDELTSQQELQTPENELLLVEGVAGLVHRQ